MRAEEEGQCCPLLGRSRVAWLLVKLSLQKRFSDGCQNVLGQGRLAGIGLARLRVGLPLASATRWKQGAPCRLTLFLPGQDSAKPAISQTARWASIFSCSAGFVYMSHFYLKTFCDSYRMQNKSLAAAPMNHQERATVEGDSPELEERESAPGARWTARAKR